MSTTQECMANQTPDRFDGLLPFVCVDGDYYEKTGNRDGWGVYCKFGDFERFCKSLSNEGGFVFRAGEMIPIADYQTDKIRSFTPYAWQFNAEPPSQFVEKTGGG